jgi:hypothetical protein
MKIDDLKRTYGKAVLSVWPPQVLADVGTTFVRPGDGVLKGVRRIAKRLSLVIEQREARSCRRLECDEPSTLDAVEKVLRAHIDEPIQAIGDLDV